MHRMYGGFAFTDDSFLFFARFHPFSLILAFAFAFFFFTVTGRCLHCCVKANETCKVSIQFRFLSLEVDFIFS